MILIKTVSCYNGLDCWYECSRCGEKFDGSYRLPTFCPNCGHKLDKDGKPGKLCDQGGVEQLAVALAFVAIKNGLLKEPMPKVEKCGTGFDREYSCTGEPAANKGEVAK